MEASWFDRLARELSIPRARRGVLGALAAVGFSLSRRKSAHGSTASPIERSVRLSNVMIWGYQLDGLARKGAVEALLASPYQLLVLEPMQTIKGSESFDGAGLVRALHDRGKLVLAYIDIGQAEDFRTYWPAEWRAPTAEDPGDPDFLLTIDPDGWSGDYPVAFWDPRWRQLILHDKQSPLQLALDAGFDGCYLDWVSAYQDPAIAREAAAQGVASATAMVDFLRELRETARRRDSTFLMVQQNAPELIDDATASLDEIDGLALEDLSFAGGADTAWGDPESGGRPQDEQTQAHLEKLIRRYRASGKTVFCVDYALSEANTQSARGEAARAGCVSFVSQTPLDRLPI